MSESLTPRIRGGIATVKKWENPDLLLACRSEIPFHELCPEQFYLVAADNTAISSTENRIKESPYTRPDDNKYHVDDLLLKRLTLYFKGIMTWVNNPPCELCGSDRTKCRSTRGPLTHEEREGEANRVEVYFCDMCNAETTTFPRYNSPMKLLETKRGRCGEYANLFGAFCRSAGFETRYISDFTDHVWVEVWSNETSRWIMADGCEGKIDEPSMYEKGWGKDLCYNLAFTVDSVVDVTRRYTRKFNSPDFQARRMNFCSGGEMQSNMIVAQFNAMTRSSQNLTKQRIDELDRRERLEQNFFDSTLRQESWGSGVYTEGRISGSLIWRISRGEAGSDIPSNDGGDEPMDKVSSQVYHIECFHPAPYRSEECTITLLAPPTGSSLATFPACISVMGTKCGAGIPHTVSVVIVDEKYSCILQSRVFSNWTDTSSFVNKLPDKRIVSIFSDLMIDEADVEGVKEKVSRLGGFNTRTLLDEVKGNDTYFFYIGQVNQKPNWATCQSATAGALLSITLDLQTGDKLLGLKLQRRTDSLPQVISNRLPDRFMSLQSQLLATEEQKKDAFFRFMENETKNSESSVRYVGFVTKEAAPIYLISKEAFPFKKYDDKETKKRSSWITYFYVPEPMWYEDEIKVS